ncbi:TlpA disulfide reductase family protein [Janibacter cremeus]|uniref:TlpA family protein disulfide reductase n=1 Tax=Janibacter cremeus TaxID=1285192 RepID=UPI0023F706FA|nr:TlpA disulfide reductase family protein [Janibacter cremeus]WEV78695.1 TlpA disulfide reductase family protein [Janibacter cremeus]
MTAHRPTRRTVVAAASTLAVMAVSGCSSSSDTADAAQDAGYRSGDGTLHLIPADERDEPVELAGETIRDTTWDSAEHRGEVVVVNLWASWCGPCAKEAPHLVDTYEATKGQDVAFVGIDYRESSVATGLAQAETWGFVWPSIYDESGSTAIDMQGKMTTQPSTAVLDREGRIAAVVLGPVTESTLVGIIEDTLSEEG